MKELMVLALDLKRYWMAMLTNHKERQQLFKAFGSANDLSNAKTLFKENLENNELIDQIVHYFSTQVTDLIYPSKSFAVAIIYSQLIEDYFNVPFFTSLNDPNLFMDDSVYFSSYSEQKNIYDEVLKSIDRKNINYSLTQTKETLKYFKQEFWTSYGSLDEIIEFQRIKNESN